MPRSKLATRGALLAALACGPSATADVVMQFGASGLNNPAISNELTNVGIPATISSENTATAFLVPGSGPVTLTFTFRLDLGDFLFNFGYFDLASVTADPLTQQQLWATQALSGATLLFDDRAHDPVLSAATTVAGGTTLGFFIIPDNEINIFRANPGAFYPPQIADDSLRAPLFSVTDANPEQRDQLVSFAAGGSTLFAFEDLSRVSGGDTDNSFTDLVFSVDAELPPAPSPTPPPTEPIPEPASVLLLAGGLAALARVRQRR